MKNFFITAAFLLTFQPALPVRAQEVPDLSPVKEIRAEGQKLEKEWLGQKKIYKQKYEALIGKAESDLKRLEETTDQGDLSLRKKINEELSDLRRERDGLKRRLAEVSAANVIDAVKMRERIHDKIEDIKD